MKLYGNVSTARMSHTAIAFRRQPVDSLNGDFFTGDFCSRSVGKKKQMSISGHNFIEHTCAYARWALMHRFLSVRLSLDTNSGD